MMSIARKYNPRPILRNAPNTLQGVPHNIQQDAHGSSEEQGCEEKCAFDKFM